MNPEQDAKKQRTGFVPDLIADIRNRRLLPVMVALVVAIVAVPILIAGGGSDEVEGATAAVDLEPGSNESTPAVLTEAPVLRDYKDRLDAFEKKNPFRQQLSGPPKSVQRQLDRQGSQSSSALGTSDASTEAAPLADLGGASPADIGSPTSSAPLATGGEATGGEESTAGTGAGVPPAGDGGSGSGGSEKPKNNEQPPEEEMPEVGPDEVLLITFKVDLRVGPEGDTEVQRDVKSLEFAPGRDTRVFQFLNSNLRATKAAFAIDPDAFEVSGKGECEGKDDRCEFLTLRKGQIHRFLYRPEGQVYQLELLRIHRIERVLPKQQAQRLRAKTRRQWPSR